MFRVVISGNSAPHEHLTLMLGFVYTILSNTNNIYIDDDSDDDNNIMQNYMLLNCFGRDLIRFSRLLQLPVYWHKLHVTIAPLCIPLNSHLFMMRYSSRSPRGKCVHDAFTMLFLCQCKTTTTIFQCKNWIQIHLTRVLLDLHINISNQKPFSILRGVFSI